MNTKYDVGEIVYVPFVVNRIEIEGTEYNGIEKKIKYHLGGSGALLGSAITVTEKDCERMFPFIKRASDFK